jgi:uncharacterized protein (AIM24 family)
MEVTRCQTLLSDHDIISQASIACKHGFFVDDLLICNKHGFKILKLKQDIIPRSIVTYDHETIKNAGLAHSCEGWYQYALEKGYFQTIEECFPRHFWAADFDEINYAADIAGLQKQLDDLGLINMLDQEFVDALQAGGAAYTEIAAQVAAETSRATTAEGGISSAFAAADSAQTTAILGSPSANFNTLEKLENEHVTESAATAASFVLDRARLVLLEDTYTDTEVDGVCDTKIAALVNSAPAQLDTLKELSDSLAADANFSTTMTTALSARVLSTTYTSEQQAQDVLIAGKQATIVGTTAWVGAVIPATKLELSGKQNVIADGDLTIARTSGLQTALDAKQPTIVVGTAYAGAIIPAAKLELSGKQDVITDGDLSIARTSGLQTALDAKEPSVVGTTSWVGAVIPATKLELSGKQDLIADGDLSIARTSGLQTALDAKALDSVVVKKTGVQTMTQNGGTAVLSLENMTGDQKILNCTGGDGQIALSGGNVLECDRAGSMYIRSTDGNSNVSIQSRGSLKLVCDDQVRLKVAATAEADFSLANQKKLKFYESTGGGTNSVSLQAASTVAADITFTLPNIDGSNGQVLKTDGNGALSFVTAGGLAAGSNETITGNWTFDEPVIFKKPLYRTPFSLLDTVYAWNYTTNTNNIITADHSAYLYGSLSSNTGDSYFRLSSAAPVGTRIAIYSYSTYAARNQSYIGTQSNLHTIFKEGSTTHRNGWTGQGASETMKESSANWVHLNCNDKRILHKITTTTWTY